MKVTNLNPVYIKNDNQIERMNRAQTLGLCPFCVDGLKEIHKNAILFSNNSWVITESAFPYSGTKKHFLIIPKKHIIDFKDLPASDWHNFGEVVNYAINNLGVESGALLSRFGDMKTNASSIQHLHIHVISGEAHQDDAPERIEKLKVDIGHKYKDR